MSLQQSMIGSLRGNLQSVNLIWRKEKPSLERTLEYFDKSGATVTLVWNAKKAWYEGTSEMSLGDHSGSLFISDQGDLDQTREFNVEKQNIGVVQEILLFIDNQEQIHSPSADISMAPMTPSQEHDVPVLELSERPRVLTFPGNIESEFATKGRLENENARLQNENSELREQKARIKNESYDLDGQLITALEQLSAYQQQQSLMDERYNSLVKEARKIKEANEEMKFKINSNEIQAAKDHEMIRQQALDLQLNNDKFHQMFREREELIARIKYLEQNYRQGVSETQGMQWQRENQRNETEVNILRENLDQLQQREIPSLLKDKKELEQQLSNSRQRYQEELRLARQEQDTLRQENERLQNNMYPGGKKRIDQMAVEENGGREAILHMDQLTLHFEDCSQSLRSLIQLLEANIEAKDDQLDRRSQELREARMRNDKLVEEVVSRGTEINNLACRLQQVMSGNEQMTSRMQAQQNSELESPNEFKTADFNNPPMHENRFPLTSPLTSADLIKYQPGIKPLYYDLMDVTHKSIVFNDTHIQVAKMNYVEDPKIHTGNQVICLLRGNYLIGILKVVFLFRPAPQGIGALSPITYAGIEFTEPVGQSDGSFQGVQYFETAARHAEFLTLENVYINV